MERWRSALQSADDLDARLHSMACSRKGERGPTSLDAAVTGQRVVAGPLTSPPHSTRTHGIRSCPGPIGSTA